MRCIAGAVMAVVGAVDAASGQVIDFETLPDGSMPTDDQQVSLETAFSDGGISVRFGWDTTGDLQRDTPLELEAVGSFQGEPVIGFINGLLDEFDVPDPAFAGRLGSYFVRRLASNPAVQRFIVDYETEVFQASGEIWDIDGASPDQYERWRVEAIGADGAVVDVFESPALNPPSPFDPANSFDGEPLPFVVDSTAGIRRLIFTFIGPNQSVGPFAFDNFRASSTIPGPTLLTRQPDHRVTDPVGVLEARLYWSEPVTIAARDLSVLTNDAAGQPVPFTLVGSGTQVTTIIFTGSPGGPDTGGAIPLRFGAYEIRVRDTALASANNAPIDGDNDGVAGGEARVVVEHTCAADLAEPFGQLAFGDISAFIAVFNSGCTAP